MADYYVDSVNGIDDAGRNGSTSQTWATVSYAMTRVAAGDTIKYYGTNVLTAEVDWSQNNLTLVGCDAAWTEGAALGVLNGNSAATDIIDIQGKTGGTIKYIEMKNATANGVDSNGSAAAAGWTIKHCHVHNCGSFGIYSRWLTGANISHNTVNNCGSIGIYGLNSAQVRYTYNLCYANGSSGLMIATSCFTYGNVCYNNTTQEIYTQGASSAIAKNVVVCGASSTVGINVFNSSNCRLYDNRISGTTGISYDALTTGCSENWNHFYTCTTAISDSGSSNVSIGDSVSDSNDPFQNAAGGDYRTDPDATLAFSVKPVGYMLAGGSTTNMDYTGAGLGVGPKPTFPAAGEVVNTASAFGWTGSLITPTFDEASRNTDPGIANVKTATSYKILNVDKTGTYNPLSSVVRIRTVSPATGTVDGGTAVTITGENFGATQGAGSVTIGGTAATIVSWADTSISITTPAGSVAGDAAVVVTNNSGSSDTLSTGFKYTSSAFTVRGYLYNDMLYNAGSNTLPRY